MADQLRECGLCRATVRAPAAGGKVKCACGSILNIPRADPDTPLVRSASPAAAPTSAPAVPFFKKNPGCAWGIVLIVVVVGWVIYANVHHTTTFDGTVLSVTAVDPATVEVTIDVENTGSSDGVAQCTITAGNAGGAYSGFDTWTTDDAISAGDTKKMSGPITITGQGAQYVTTASADCESP